MTNEEAKRILEYHQKWRKGAEVEQTDVKKLSEAMDVAIEVIDPNIKLICEQEKQLREQGHEIISLQEENERLKIQASNYAYQIDLAKRERDKAEAEMESLKSFIKKQNESVDELMLNNTTYHSKMVEYEQEIESLKGKLNEVRKILFRYDIVQGNPLFNEIEKIANL